MDHRRLTTPVLALFAAAASAQVPTDWTFELQCRSSLNVDIPAFNLPIGGSLSSQSVSLAEDGSVVVRVVLAGASGATEGIFHGAGGVGGLVLTVNDPEPIWSSDIGYRNGLIALDLLDFTAGAAVYDNSGALVRDFPAGGPEGTSGFSGITMLSDGAIAYRADFGFVGDKTVIDEFVADVRTQTLIADTISDPYSFLFTPDANDARQVVSKVLRSTDATDAVLLFEAGQAPVVVAEEGPSWNAFVNSTAIAENGTVAFTGRRAADLVWQVTRWDAGTPAPVASGGDLGIVNGSLANFPPDVNSSGWVVFRATDASGAPALFVGDGTSLVRLVGAGDPMPTDLGPINAGFDFGGTTGVQTLNASVAINDAGQVGFGMFLENGTIGVYVATPGSPCPADLNGDDLLDFFDVSAFLAAFNAQDPVADFNGDDLFDFFDVSAFLAAFNAGC